MQQQSGRRARVVIGPEGNAISIADLPSASVGARWVIRKKAIVVAAVRGGLLSIEDACSLYDLTLEEFMSWQSSVDRYGLMGLRTTKLQQYRAAGIATQQKPVTVERAAPGRLSLNTYDHNGPAEK